MARLALPAARTAGNPDGMAVFRFGGRLVLVVHGASVDVGHALAEYGPARLNGVVMRGILGPGGIGPDLEVAFGPASTPRDDRGGTIEGSHKTTRWHVDLGPADARPLTAAIRIKGVFGHSFVQGYVVEPLLSVAAVREGQVLLPAAAIASSAGTTEGSRAGETSAGSGTGAVPRADAGGCILLVGASSTGKTTLAARALIAGREVLADDQTLLDTEGSAWPFPRRLRLYPDLPRTSAAVHRRLPDERRRELVRHAVLSRLSGGLIRLPILADPSCLADPPGEISEVGRPVPAPLPPRAPRRVDRIVVLERSPAVDRLSATPLEPGEVVDVAVGLIERQRSRLRAASAAWSSALDDALGQERRVLARTIATLPAERLVVPKGWPAARAIDALDRHLGISR